MISAVKITSIAIWNQLVANGPKKAKRKILNKWKHKSFQPNRNWLRMWKSSPVYQRRVASCTEIYMKLKAARDVVYIISFVTPLPFPSSSLQNIELSTLICMIYPLTAKASLVYVWLKFKATICNWTWTQVFVDNYDAALPSTKNYENVDLLYQTSRTCSALRTLSSLAHWLSWKKPKICNNENVGNQIWNTMDKTWEKLCKICKSTWQCISGTVRWELRGAFSFWVRDLLYITSCCSSEPSSQYIAKMLYKSTFERHWR